MHVHVVILACMCDDTSVMNNNYAYVHSPCMYMNDDTCYVLSKGLFCIRYPDMMLRAEMRSLINNWLTKDCSSTKKIEVCL